MRVGPCLMLLQLQEACSKQPTNEKASLYPSKSGDVDNFLHLRGLESPNSRLPIGDGQAIWCTSNKTRVLRRCEPYAEAARQACDQIGEICQKLGLSDRSVQHFKQQKVELMSAAALETELSQLLDSEGGLLSILQEELDGITDLAEKGKERDVERAVTEFTSLLDKHKQKFIQKHGVDRLYHCFHGLIERWQQKLPEKLFWLKGASMLGDPVIKALNTQCDQFLHQLGEESSIPNRYLSEDALQPISYLKQLSEENIYDSFRSTPQTSLLGSLQSFSTNIDPYASLIGHGSPRVQEWQTQPLPDGKGSFIPVDIHNIDYYELCNEPRFHQKDFEYLKAGSFKINTRAAKSLVFTHDEAYEDTDQRWDINVAINRDDLDRAYPVIMAWIMNPENRVYSAKIINQETREGDTHTGKEVVLKLFENDRFKNVNAAHWQEKLTELESALKLVGIRSGTRPDPEKHKFDRKVKGSDLFYYRNAAVKVEESIDDSVLDLYQKKQDPVTNITYYCVKPEFAQGQENTMPVILEGEFASIPVEHRHNPLAGIHPDYMSQVDLNPVLKPHHASNKGFELRNNSSAKVRLPNLPLDQEIAFMNTLQGVNKYFPDMSEEQLKRLLLNPETGDYQELDRRCLPTMIIVNYLTLQQADPKCFTDQGFYWASRLRQFTCYGEGYIPEGKAHELWLKETRNAVVTDMAVRKQLEHINLTSLLPEGRDFERFKQRLKGVKIPEDMLDDYKNNIREEAYLYLFHFGGPLGKDQCDQIFRDCTQKLVEQLDPEEDANKSNEHYKIYNSMTFDWFDRNLHEKYKAHQSPGFVAYQDGDATSQYASRFKDEDNPKLANKFRISIHPHDYKKAWDIVAKVLCENESPFLQWKAIPPWKTKVGIEQSRLKIGGQFTLYSVDSEESKDVERFKPAQTARVLQQIEQELKSRRIRPGIQPRSDIDLGPDHPFLSYRYDMDKENKYYQPAVLVGHQRRIEYRQMPRYQDVFQILNQ